MNETKTDAGAVGPASIELPQTVSVDLTALVDDTLAEARLV